MLSRHALLALDLGVGPPDSQEVQTCGQTNTNKETPQPTKTPAAPDVGASTSAEVDTGCMVVSSALGGWLGLGGLSAGLLAGLLAGFVVVSGTLGASATTNRLAA